MMSAILLEQEREAHRLKSVISSTSDRLELEIGRAERAELRAEYDAIRLQDITGRLQAEQAARMRAEAEETRWREESTRWESKAAECERESKRVRTEMKKLEQSMNEALEETEEYHSEMQRLEFALRERQALEESREEGRAKAWEMLLAKRHGKLDSRRDRRKGTPKVESVERKKNERPR